MAKTNYSYEKRQKEIAKKKKKEEKRLNKLAKDVAKDQPPSADNVDTTIDSHDETAAAAELLNK
ncbi:MAG: hypothetical protein ACJAU1_000687 [Psychromonas sp.]|jgi:hypothetical protein